MTRSALTRRRFPAALLLASLLTLVLATSPARRRTPARPVLRRSLQLRLAQGHLARQAVDPLRSTTAGACPAAPQGRSRRRSRVRLPAQRLQHSSGAAASSSICVGTGPAAPTRSGSAGGRRSTRRANIMVTMRMVHRRAAGATGATDACADRIRRRPDRPGGAGSSTRPRTSSSEVATTVAPGVSRSVDDAHRGEPLPTSATSRSNAEGHEHVRPLGVDLVEGRTALRGARAPAPTRPRPRRPSRPTASPVVGDAQHLQRPAHRLQPSSPLEVRRRARPPSRHHPSAIG